MRHRAHVGGRGEARAQDDGIGVAGKQCTAFFSAIAHKDHFALGEQVGKGIVFHDFGLGLGLRMTLRIKQLREDLHAAGIDHRADPGLDAVREVGDRHRQGFQAADAEQGDVEGHAEALGDRDADAQAGVGAGAFGDGDRREVCGPQIEVLQQPLDHDRHEAGMGAVGVDFLEGDEQAVFKQRDAAHRRGGFDREDAHFGGRGLRVGL